MMLLLAIIMIGPGKLSLDYVMRQFVEKQNPPQNDTLAPQRYQWHQHMLYWI